MLVFGQIFFGFETAWSHNQKLHRDHRVGQLLSEIHLPKLSRSTRLHSDLKTLGARFPMPTNLNRNRNWQNEIENSIHARPHLIFAYAWTMYLAIFNGGRFIRAQLHNAGPEFWDPPTQSRHSSSSSENPKIDCLTFWDFQGDLDGEDIREEFDRRFESAAEHLTNAEKDDIIKQAVDIFGMCEDMIAYLDSVSTAAVSSRTRQLSTARGPDQRRKETEVLSRFVQFTVVVTSICIFLSIWRGVTTMS